MQPSLPRPSRRRVSRCLCLALTGLSVLLGVPSLQPAERPPAGQTPSLGLARLIGGVDYVPLATWARRFQMTVERTGASRTVHLKGEKNTLLLTVDKLDVSLNGLHLFLGDPIRLIDDVLYLSRRDAEQFLGILLAPPAPTSPPVRTIILDPGHGGKDPGKENHRLKLAEKTFTLDVALRLETLLKARGYQVILTRREDRYVELEERTAFVRRHQADLFVSIHFNAFEAPRVTGTETFILTPQGQASVPEAEKDRKGEALAYPGNRYDTANLLLGHAMHTALIKALGLVDRGLKRYRYSVLRTADCPAVLVESAFISNDEEAGKIADARYRQTMAEAIAAGIDAFSYHVGRGQSKD